MEAIDKICIHVHTVPIGLWQTNSYLDVFAFFESKDPGNLYLKPAQYNNEYTAQRKRALLMEE